MDIYAFGHFPLPVQGFCEAVGTTPGHKNRGLRNADLYSGGRPVAPSFSSSRFECGSLCVYSSRRRERARGSLIRFVQRVSSRLLYTPTG